MNGSRKCSLLHRMDERKVRGEDRSDTTQRNLDDDKESHHGSKRERVKRKTTEDKMAPAMTAAKRNFMGKSVVARQTRAARAVARRNASLVVKAGAYDEELIATAVSTREREREREI